ncbi:YceI family protein [Saccharopolyspora sp. HNM0983]|uniref:YceI family protein n=2 Tax=Saccharopolyspora montiporae TaxID=2781240 RepID=A0A929G1I7_9PSEU|nr:YceI family protein [Saccharopolyspora sp. HNM0983]MBE9374723.1 YceI family protein [Saccharopolyspora sp. HNM0983]
MDHGRHEAVPGSEPAGGAVTGSVRAADGWPIPEAVLTVVDATGAQVARVQGDAEGAVVVRDVAPGTYTAIVTAVGHEPVARTTLVTAGGPGELGAVELRRAGGAELPEPGRWRIDPVHSSILATARHLGISSIHGRFTDFSGQVLVADPVERSAVEVSIAASSVDTANAMRDDHLRGADFLDVANHPEIAFRSTALTRRGTDRWDLDGELTLCGVTRPVRLDTRFAGVGPDPWGGTRASASATTQLRREDFAMTFNQALQTGIAAIGTTLRVEIDIQAVREG